MNNCIHQSEIGCPRCEPGYPSRPMPDDPDSPLDPGILPYVAVLRAHGVETFESCQGGHGHCSAEPFVRFHGGPAEGIRAVGVALAYRLAVDEVRRYWTVVDGDLTGPYWKMTFREKAADEVGGERQ